MALVLFGLGQAFTECVIIAEIISSLPPTFNNVIAAWSNVNKEKQTSVHLEECLLRHEAILKAQGNIGEF